MRLLLPAVLTLVLAGCGPDRPRPAPESHADTVGTTPTPVWEAAKQRGVSFRAVGNEPGWLMEITDGDRIRLLLDYADREFVLPNPGPSSDPSASRTVYHVATDSMDVTVTIDALECADTMSDERFESTVTLLVGDRAYHGCGRALH